MELASIVEIEIHEAICIAVKTASTLSGFEVRSKGGRCLLLSFDEVCSASVVECSRGCGCSVVKDEGKSVSKIRRESFSCFGTNSVSTVDNKRSTRRFPGLQP